MDLNTSELFREKIFVNKPLRFGGMTLYQTDWSMAALLLKVNGSHLIQQHVPITVPLVSLEGQTGFSGRVWGAFIPAKTTKGISLLVRDFQSVAIYDSMGQFAGVRRIGSKRPMIVEGIELVVLDALGNTGIELKADPAVPMIYAGFGFFLFTSFLSSVSFSQVWAIQEGSTLHVGGKSSRAYHELFTELNLLYCEIPEYIEI